MRNCTYGCIGVDPPEKRDTGSEAALKETIAMINRLRQKGRARTEGGTVFELRLEKRIWRDVLADMTFAQFQALTKDQPDTYI